MYTACMPSQEVYTASRPRPMPSDEALIRRIANGDKLAMRALFAAHQVRVYRYVMRIVRNREMAEDVVSDVFLDIWQHAGRFQARSAVSTWVLAIARYKALSAIRRISTEQKNVATVALVDQADDPEVATQNEFTGDVLRRCLAALPAAHSEIIDLVYYQGKSVKEIAQIVSIPENTVKTRMFHARQRLAKLLAAAGIDRVAA